MPKAREKREPFYYFARSYLSKELEMTVLVLLSYEKRYEMLTAKEKRELLYYFSRPYLS
jgi:hypothetical protein